MTFREKLADWISGGALTRAREWSEYEAKLARRAEKRASDWQDNAAILALRCHKAHDALDAIADATDGGKSGTAIKINRMAREALK